MSSNKGKMLIKGDHSSYLEKVVISGGYLFNLVKLFLGTFLDLVIASMESRNREKVKVR